MSRLEEIIDTFRAVDAETRLELLLDYAKRLPPLPARFEAQREAGANRVHECMTPVFLWVEGELERVDVHAWVAEEAPTVKGMLGIVVEGLSGEPAATVAAAPLDLPQRLGLDSVIRMNRMVGLNAVLGRVKSAAAEAAGRGSEASTPTQDGRP